LIGASVGYVIRQSLPKHQLTDETKSTQWQSLLRFRR
jgi:hypothetical protein